jgi:hypothetical protein
MQKLTPLCNIISFKANEIKQWQKYILDDMCLTTVILHTAFWAKCFYLHCSMKKLQLQDTDVYHGLHS